MEKTNELNKFLSYMHMGNTIYRIYLEHAKKLENEKLIHLIIEIDENKELSKGIKEYIIKVIDDYGIIINKLKEFLLQEYR